MRIAALGLEVGSKRIGVAGCDGLGLIATGITTISLSKWSFSRSRRASGLFQPDRYSRN